MSCLLRVLFLEGLFKGNRKTPYLRHTHIPLKARWTAHWPQCPDTRPRSGQPRVQDEDLTPLLAASFGNFSRASNGTNSGPMAEDGEGKSLSLPCPVQRPAIDPKSLNRPCRLCMVLAMYVYIDVYTYIYIEIYRYTLTFRVDGPKKSKLLVYH